MDEARLAYYEWLYAVYLVWEYADGGNIYLIKDREDSKNWQMIAS